LLQVLLCVATPAGAGHYNVAYSYGHWDVPYSTGDYEQIYFGYGAMPSYDGTDSFASCSGAITATFTWVPDFEGDDPPASVILEEECTCNANWSWEANSGGSGGGGGGSPSGAATVDSGLGGTPTMSSDSTSGSANIDQTRTTARVNPGTTFTVGCSPSAFASTGSGYSYASVGYRVLYTPVTVGFLGTTPINGHDEAIIGQGVSAYLLTSPFDFPWYHFYPVSNYAWQVTGGDPFKHYYVEPTGAQQGHAQFLSGSDLTQEMVHFYCRKDEAVTVTCSADVTVNGQILHLVGSGKFTTVAPTSSLTADLTHITFYIDGNNITLGAVDPVTNGYIPCVFKGRASDPIGFGTGGSWHFLQTVNPSTTLTSGGIDTKIPAPPKWGVLGLDRKYPYDPAPAIPDANAPGRYASDNTEQTTVDSPGYSWPNLAALNAVTHIKVDKKFNMYLMYLPPGLDVEWVPAYKLDWFISVDADQPNGGWQTWASTHDGSTAVGTTGVTSGGIWHVHPEWDIVQ